MSDIDRREFIGAAALGLVGVLPPQSDGVLETAGPRRRQGRADGRDTHARRLRRARETGRPARAGPRRGLPDAAQLGRLRRRRIAARDARHRGARARRVLRARLRRACSDDASAWTSCTRRYERHELARPGLRRHAPEDRHSPRRAGRAGDSRAGGDAAGLGPRLPARARARRRGGVPHRQRGLPRALRSRLAHHGHDRAPSARRPRAAGCSDCPSSRCAGRSAWRRRSPSVCARCSAR